MVGSVCWVKCIAVPLAHMIRAGEGIFGVLNEICHDFIQDFVSIWIFMNLFHRLLFVCI